MDSLARLEHTVGPDEDEDDRVSVFLDMDRDDVDHFAWVLSAEPTRIILGTDVDEDIIECILSHETLHSVLNRRLGVDVSRALDVAPWRRNAAYQRYPHRSARRRQAFRKVLRGNRDGLV